MRHTGNTSGIHCAILGGDKGERFAADNAVARGTYADIGFEEIKEVVYLFSGRLTEGMSLGMCFGKKHE